MDYLSNRSLRTLFLLQRLFPFSATVQSEPDLKSGLQKDLREVGGLA